MDPFADVLLDQPSEDGGTLRQQALVGCLRGEGEDTPPDAVGHRLGVTLDEAHVGKDPQGSRHLAGIASQMGRQPVHAPAAVSDGIVRGERVEQVDSATETARLPICHPRNLAD